MDVISQFFLNCLFALWSALFYVPGFSYVFAYIKSSYQNDPIRVIFEGFLVLFTFKYLKSKNKRKHEDKLSREEEEELISEWTPAPLVSSELPPLVKLNMETINSITSETELFVTTSKSGQDKVVNLVSFNPLGLLNLPELKTVSEKAIKKYGVGTCGPPGFYGTLDIHLELEKEIARFLQTKSVILYSQNFSAITSVIPAFSKRGDIIVCDTGVNFALQRGVQISRSDVFYFQHNDMVDLERILNEVESLYAKKPISRRFIVTEGLFSKFGDICPLPQLVALKKKFKYRLILDESLSIGSLGSRGAGLTDYFSDKLSVDDIDMIIGSLGHAFGTTGGFCAGSTHIIDHQRLGGQAYCFSASLPALLTAYALEAIRNMPSMEMTNSSVSQVIEKSLLQLRENISLFKELLISKLPQRFEARSQEEASVCLIHIQISKKYSQGDYLEEAKILQGVCDRALENHRIFITRAKEVYSEDLNVLPPSIKLCISGALARAQIENAALGLLDSFITIDRQQDREKTSLAGKVE